MSTPPNPEPVDQRTGVEAIVEPIKAIGALLGFAIGYLASWRSGADMTGSVIHPTDRPAYSLDRMRADTLAMADAVRTRSVPAARPLDGRHGLPWRRDATRPRGSSRS